MNAYFWLTYSHNYGVANWGGPFGDHAGIGGAALFVGLPDGTFSDSTRGLVVTMSDSNTETSFSADKYVVSCEGTTATVERIANHILIGIPADTSCSLRVFIDDGTGAAYEMTGSGGPMALEYTTTLSRDGDLYKVTAGIFGRTSPPVSTADAPTIVSAVGGDGQVTVSFTAPVDDGGASITNYEYSTDGGTTWIAFSPAITSSPATISGLTNGTMYNIALRAVNSAGSGTASSSTSVTPGITAGAPTGLSATAGDGQVSVSFTAPADHGDSDISNYEYSTDGGTTWIALNPATTTSPVTISGLTNGTAYNIALRAVNASGPGAASSTTSTTPITTAGAPTGLSTTVGDGQVSVSFTAPANNGGSAITNYEYSTDGGTTWIAFSPATTTSPATITGLTNGTDYNVALRAVNGAGAGAASSASSVTPLTVAGAPTGLSATAGDGEATVSFTPPSDTGGSAITNYEYSTDGGTTWVAISPAKTTSPVKITGLTNGADYSIALRAVTEAGAGAASTAVPFEAGSPKTLFEDAEEAVREMVVNEAARSLQSTLSASQRMVRDARDRMIADGLRNECSEDRLADCGPDDTAGPRFSNSFTAAGTNLSTKGTFFDQTAGLDGTSRRLVFGDFDIQHDGETGSSTATVTGRIAWEGMLSEQTMLGYFIGGEVSHSDIAGAFDGHNQRLGLLFGAYAVHELRPDMYADGFLSLGAGRNNVKMADDLLGLHSDYVTRTLAFGAALSARYDRGQYLFMPELSVLYGRTLIGDLDFAGEAYGIVDNTLSLNAGAVSLAELTLRAEVRLPLDNLPVVDSLNVFNFAPRVVCRQVEADDVERTCGVGGELGFSGGSYDGRTTYNLKIIADRTGRQTGTSVLLGFERRF